MADLFHERYLVATPPAAPSSQPAALGIARASSQVKGRGSVARSRVAAGYSPSSRPPALRASKGGEQGIVLARAVEPCALARRHVIVVSEHAATTLDGIAGTKQLAFRAML